MTKRISSPLASFAIGLIGAALWVAAPARAQSGDDFKMILDHADTNRDGQVTWSEFAAVRSGMFDRMDRNEDGFVDRKDRPRMFGSRFDQAYRMMSTLDANSDGRVSRAELHNGKSPAFDAADTNGDRVLSADEVARISAKR